MSVALQVLKRAALGLVDRQLVEIHGAKPRELRVLIREQTSLQQRILGYVDAGRHVGRQEGNLLGLGEKVVWVTIQHHPSDYADRDKLLGDEFGRIENVERQRV